MQEAFCGAYLNTLRTGGLDGLFPIFTSLVIQTKHHSRLFSFKVSALGILPFFVRVSFGKGVKNLSQTLTEDLCKRVIVISLPTTKTDFFQVCIFADLILNISLA